MTIRSAECGLYGLHGTNLSDAEFEKRKVYARRVSGGCVRNPHQPIATAVHDVLKAANPQWEQQLTDLDPKPSSNVLKRWTITGLPMDRSSYVIVYGNDQAR